MNPMAQIIPLLKQLRLSGILDSLEIRNRQAIDQKLSYSEFLALLIQDEVARRENRKLSLRLRRAGFGSQKTLEGFDFSFNPTINQAQIMDLATCRFMEERVSVLIVGPTGTGKSHIAQALGHEAIRRGYDVSFTTQGKLATQLQSARATHLHQRRLSTLAKVDLLIIDDFGLKPLHSPQDEDFHELISERYERRATVVTSNLEFSEWVEAFPNRLLGAAVIDRLGHGAYRVVIEGKSYRASRPSALKKERS
jgi:DNA replication protein DnaC